MKAFEKIDTAIDVLSDKITPATKPDEALKYTQAALNMAHVKAQLQAVEREQLESPEKAQKRTTTKGTG